MLHVPRTSRVLVAVGLAFAVISLGGCSNDDDPTTLDDADQSADIDGFTDQDFSDIDPDMDLDSDSFDDPGFEAPDTPSGVGKELSAKWPSHVPVPDGLVIQGGNTFDTDGELKVGFRGRATIGLTELDELYRGVDGWMADQDPVDPDVEVVQLTYGPEDENEILVLTVQNLGSSLDINASYTAYKNVD